MSTVLPSGDAAVANEFMVDIGEQLCDFGLNGLNCLTGSCFPAAIIKRLEDQDFIGVPGKRYALF